MYRQRERAIRSAPGAGRRRLAAPVFAQIAIVIAVGAGAGIAMAASLLGVLRASPVLSGVRLAALDYRIDARALGFALLACALAWFPVS